MAQTTDSSGIVTDILNVASGNRDIKVGFYPSEILMIGAVILIAVFVAVALANLVTRKK